MPVSPSKLFPGLPAQTHSISLPQNKLLEYWFGETVQNAYRLEECTSTELFLECFQTLSRVMKADKKPRANFLEEDISLTVASPAPEERIPIIER
jgi:hypothetical protein